MRSGPAGSASAIGLVVLLTGALCAGEAVRVDCCPGVEYGVCGKADITAATGLVVNGSARDGWVKELREINLPATRCYVWAFGEFMDRQPRGRPYLEKLEEFFKTDFDKEIPLLFDRHLGIDSKTGKRISNAGMDPQFWQLEQLVTWGATKNTVLQFCQPHPRTEKDFEPMARGYRACLREIKKRYPALGREYVMIFNEPDFEYPRAWDGRNREESLKFFAAFYNYMRKSIKEEFPETELIGPGIAGFLGFAGYDLWLKDWLKYVPDSKFINAQPYCSRFIDLAAWTSLVEAESLRQNKQRVGLIITEHNTDIHGVTGNWWEHKYHVKRIHDEADIFFGIFRHPEMFAIKNYFLMYTFNCHDIVFRHDNKIELAPSYHLFWILRDLRGRRVYADVSRDEDRFVRAVASRNGQDVVLALFNDSKERRDAALNVVWPKSMAAPAGTVEYLRYNSETEHFDVGFDEALNAPTLSFAPNEIKKVRWTVPNGTGNQQQTEATRGATESLGKTLLDEEEFYADHHAIYVGAEPLKCRFGGHALRANETAFLRCAVNVDDMLTTERIAWMFNGHEMCFPVNADTGQLLYVDVPLPREWMRDDNAIVFAANAEAPYRVAFASLVYRPVPQGVQPMAARLAESFLPPPRLQLVLPVSVTPGVMDATLSIPNKTKGDLAGALTYQAAPGWRFVDPPAQAAVKPGETAKVALRLEVPVGQVRGVQYVEAVFAPEGAEKMKARRGTVYYPPVTAFYAAEPPKLDGDLSDWKAQPVTMSHPAANNVPPYETSLFLMWDERNLYAALEVKGRKLIEFAAGREDFWTADTLEMFLDFNAAKSGSRDEHTMQAWSIFRNAGKGGTVTHGKMAADPNGILFPQPAPTTWRGAVRETDTGFVFEAAYDWAGLSQQEKITSVNAFVPKPDQTIGFDAALLNRNISAGPGRNHASPAWWGILRLAKPGTPVPAQPLTAVVAERPGAIVFAPDRRNGWRLPPGARIDERGIHLGNHPQHTMWTLNPTPDFFNDEGMTISFTLNGAKKLDPKAKPGYMMDLRPFLSPCSLKEHLEPYVVSECVCFYLRHSTEGIAIDVQQKSGGGGFGRGLWGGHIATADLPVTIKLWLNKTDYRLTFDKQLKTLGGSVSGHHQIDQAKWKTPAHFIMKGIWGDDNSEAEVQRMEVYPGR
ncbi:MAG: hypothetical protein NTW87_24095 [Planctomycetota bacterium]|nr:hypothetical protein [Planctomycetota bacterium]